ncbi:MAG: hypothetical protein ACI9K2_003439, partial [Myxococcota bacterium]
SEGGRRRIPLTTGCFDRSADPEHARPVQSRVQLSSLAQWRTDQQRAAQRFSPANATVPAPLAALLEALGYAE